MSDYKLLPTTPEVWAVIKARHHSDLVVYGSFTDPYGEFNGGTKGTIATTYALKGADYPLMEARSTWDNVPGDPKHHNETHEYWLCVPQKCE